MDIYQTVTNRICELLDQEIAPWVRPWSTVPDPLPVNASTERPYRGINTLMLQLEAQTRGYARGRWLTYRQAQALGGQVRKGAEGVPVVFYELCTKDDAAEDNEDKLQRILRVFTVFNVAQIEGLPETCYGLSHEQPIWRAYTDAEHILAASLARLEHGGTRAFYKPREDLIVLPERRYFEKPTNYYCTAFHELSHWTGHPSRCARDLKGRFGDDSYAMEELIAELGGSFLCASVHIDGLLMNAAYIDAWLRILKADKRAVFIAAGQAQKAADYVLKLAHNYQAAIAA